MAILHESRLIKVWLDPEGDIVTIEHKNAAAKITVYPTQRELPKSLVVTPGEKSEMIVANDDAWPAVRVVTKIHTARRRHKR